MNFATGLTEDFGNQNSRYDCSTHAWLTPQSKLLSFVHSHFLLCVAGPVFLEQQAEDDQTQAYGGGRVDLLAGDQTEKE